LSEAESFGESSFDNALPWVQIKAADYAPADDLKFLLPVLQARHDERISIDTEFGYLREDIAEYQLQRKKNAVSLNEAERRKELYLQEAKTTSREARRTHGNRSGDQKNGRENVPALRDDGLQPEERTLVRELADEKAGKNAKDIVLDEAAHILGDEVGLLKPKASLASRLKPGVAWIRDEAQGADAIPAGAW